MRSPDFNVLGHDRRYGRRVPVAMAVKQRVGTDLSLCQAGNLGPGGLYLARAAEDFFPPLRDCLLEFGLPGSDRLIEARGQVVRQQRRGGFHLMAVRFAGLTPKDRHVIKRFAESPPPTPSRQSFETA